jgi:hypothetical protein
VAKEAEIYGKREREVQNRYYNFGCIQKYKYGKRGLNIWQKRPKYVEKKAYICGKRERELQFGITTLDAYKHANIYMCIAHIKYSICI